MATIDELRKTRIEKKEKLEQMGINPYPAKARKKNTAQEAKSMLGKEVLVAGRLRGLRGHGALLFADLVDQSGKIQLFFSKDILGEKYELLKLVDLGDFLEASGEIFTTQAGENTVRVTDFALLSKSIRPLPEKWHGIVDSELRLRKRYLDMIMNPEVREMFVKKAIFWQTIRCFLLNKNFIEVETPVLESVPGGAEARPFITHYNALDTDFYLRISLELPLKRLMVAGFDRVFEIGRIFRNEGMDAEHLQDYTQMEFYWAYADYNDLMVLLREMYQEVVKAVLGTTKATYQGVEIDWGGEWKIYDYYELFKENTGLDLNTVTEEELREKADSLRIKYEEFAQRGRLIDLIYKQTVRPKLIEPGFLINPPVEIEPLAKRMQGNPGRVERLQIMAWGTELGKGFSELNDPLDQRARFEEQMKLREAGDEEAQRIDEDYLEAMEYGMPPTGGFGMSERFFAFLMDKPIREIIIFPPMRREIAEKKEKK
jgi:lysyl-tRNA synthetase class 2